MMEEEEKIRFERREKRMRTSNYLSSKSQDIFPYYDPFGGSIHRAEPCLVSPRVPVKDCYPASGLLRQNPLTA